MSNWLFQISRTVNYLKNSPKEERSRVTKPKWELLTMDDDDRDVMMDRHS